MIRRSVFALTYACLLGFFLETSLSGQAGNGSILGHVTDSAGAVVQQARVEVQPSGGFTTTDQNGDFQISALTPGEYTLTVSYVGFSIYSVRAVVRAGEPLRVSAVLQLGTQNEAVIVHADRQGGEVEALDIQRTADNVIKILPADVITSLPNTNMDAVGRLPSISLERDEGEGKYIQISRHRTAAQ